MPIYEYQCEKCEHEFEREQRITDDPVKTCPKCRSRRVKKLISMTSFVLKGSGWYSDLYSSPSGDKDKKSSDDTKDSGDKSDKGESKSSESTSADAPSKDKDSKSKDKKAATPKPDSKAKSKKGSKAA